MLQRYKLRLGDGTVLGVDLQGLTTWALDGRAMVQAADSHQWYPLKEFLAKERAAARRAARVRAHRESRADSGSPRPLPLVYPKPREDKPRPKVEEPAEVPAPTDAPPLVAEPEEVGGGVEPVEGSDVTPGALPLVSGGTTDLEGLEPLEALPVETPLAFEAAEPGRLGLAEPEVPVLAEEDVEAFTSEFLPAPSPAEEPSPNAEPVVAEAAGAEAEPTWIPEEATTPVVPPEPTFAASAPVPPPSTLEEDFPQVGYESPGADSAPPSALPSELVLPPRAGLQVLADDTGSRSQPPVTQAWRPGAAVPIIRLKPVDDEPPPAEGHGAYDGYDGRDLAEATPSRRPWEELVLRWLSRAAIAYDGLLTGWIQLLARPSTSVSATRSADASAPPSSARIPWVAIPSPDADSPTIGNDHGGLSRRPLAPPPALQDLPVLSLADLPEPVDEGDVYVEERRPSEAWWWTKRLVVASTLLVGIVFAALRWEVWVPQADRIGREVFSRIDEIREERERRERQREAFQEATERLPHLSPETIQLLIARSPAGIPDPPEMFRVASEASDRGAKALTAEELRELRELRRQVVGALRASERERIREYDLARARRLVFPFEGLDVIELVGRGAYMLTPEGRERLQQLNAKAIAAGLPSPDAPPATDRP